MGSLKKHQEHSSNELFNNPFVQLQQEVNHAMNDFLHLFDPVKTEIESLRGLTLTPALDFIEQKDCYKVEAEMPGMGEEDIHVSFDGNKLLIKGEKTSSKKDDDKHFISREISYGCYERSILLPITADVSRASASFKKGMLWVIIPKQAIKKSASKEIKIEKA